MCLSMCLSKHLWLSVCLSILNVSDCFSIEEECRQSVCTAVLEKRNMALHLSFKKLTVVVSKVNSYLQAVVQAGMEGCVPVMQLVMY
jgi:hypothetical protein